MMNFAVKFFVYLSFEIIPGFHFFNCLEKVFNSSRICNEKIGLIIFEGGKRGLSCIEFLLHYAP